MSCSSDVDERTLREIYLPAFETAVKKAQPYTVMCSYNKINGTFASENPWLLTDVLRDEWGFEGYVMSDWGAVNERVEGLKAGLELEMPTSNGINDREIIAGLEANIAELEKLQEENEANKADLNESKGTLDEKKQQLNGQVSQIQGQIEDIDALQKQYEANKAEIDKMMAQVQSEINDIYASYESQGEYTGGVMTWPVPGYTGITSYYGWRFNNTDFHTGIDISGSNIYGRNIVAAADGVVIKAQETYVQGVGYGRYLIIDHGGNISTLYGHTSQLLVSEGDHVTRGQAIAKVGSTGWSTGPHLHFEVRENGTAVNPLSGYLKP